MKAPFWFGHSHKTVYCGRPRDRPWPAFAHWLARHSLWNMIAIETAYESGLHVVSKAGHLDTERKETRVVLVLADSCPTRMGGSDTLGASVCYRESS